jgi:predicted O-methyltransferase YrrM
MKITYCPHCETFLEKHGTDTHSVYSQFSLATEVEMGSLLYGLVRQIKPELVFEHGAGMGHGTYALGRAVQDNGKGKVVACEIEAAYLVEAVERVRGLPVEMLHKSVVDCPEVEKADFIFADGDNENRIVCFDRAKPGCIFVVHDTTEPELEEFVRKNNGQVFNFGRGFGILTK